MKKDKPIILVDPFPRTMDILFSKENLKYLNNNFKLLNAPKKNKINFYKKNLPNALYIFGQPDLPTELLKTQTTLKAIFNVESNFMNNMDYEYCFKNNIHVLATSPVFAQPVAEMALGLTLSIARSIHIAHNDFIKGREKYGGAISKNNFLLKNKTFGFIGFGDLAKATLPLIRVFSNNILAYDPWISDSVIESKKVIPTSLNNIFKKSDIVYVYATSTTTNKEMIKLKNLNLFKDSSVILIMSRASVINFDDLYRFLKDRNVYAAIDVFPKEPFPKTDPFRKLKNVIFSPHRAGALDVAFKNMGEIVMKDIKLISRNLKPKNCKKAELKTVKKIISAPVKIN
tara:strand:- start:81 stop:1109 length:1029 start_codon:yes stop_codon:yes gene_type:complete